MIVFDQLRISDDGSKMYLNFHVNEAYKADGTELFASRYLDYMVIKTGDQVSESSDACSSGGDNVFTLTFGDNEKEKSLVLTPSDFNLNFTKGDFTSDLFFVYVVCKEETTDPCIPCPLADLTTLGVTFDENKFYQQVMQYSKELANDCQIPVGFTDLILRWNAFKSAIETEHYVPAVKYYNMLFGSDVVTTYKTRGCGCHG